MADILDRLDAAASDAARAKEMPERVDAMLAQLVHEAFSDEAWIFARKLDGERMLAYVEADGSVRLMSRNHERLDDTYPELQAALSRHAIAGCILDGEVVAFDSDGVSDFQALQPRFEGLRRDKDAEDVHKEDESRALSV